MNLSPGYLWASIVCTVAVLFLILLTVIDWRTPQPPPLVRFLSDPEDKREAELEMFMLTALSCIETANARYTDSRDPDDLRNGLIETWKRLVQGLDLEPDELAERLDEERQSTP